VLRSQEGHKIGYGDFIQTVRGEQVKLHLVFHFDDGSVDDETTVFTQHGSFQLVTNHHVQKGPSFPHPIELSIDAHSGQVTVRSTDKEGKEEVKTEHMDLPPDLANGMTLSLLKNLPVGGGETKVSMLAATPKLRTVRLAITPLLEDSFTLAGSSRKATHFEGKIELGGVAGVVAPLIGKELPKVQVWILGGEAPTFVREEGPFFEDGPIWRVELTSPVWSHAGEEGK